MIEWSSMEEEEGVFYVVRKGDTIGVYNTYSDCQAQAGTSLCHPPTSVYKGYNLPKEAVEFLASNGLRNAAYSINAANVKDDLFGKLVPFQKPSFEEKTLEKDATPKRSHQELVLDDSDAGGSAMPPRKHLKVENDVESRAFLSTQANPVDDSLEAHKTSSRNSGRRVISVPTSMLIPPEVDPNFDLRPTSCNTCTLKFDGASKGNPGQAGAGAVIRAIDGSVVYQVREGVGIATNNVAEYRALILGLKTALKKGFKNIRVEGDSMLVCMQVQGKWKVKNASMMGLCREAKELKDKFISFEISQIPREYNSEADAQANFGANLRNGEVEEIRSLK